MVANLRNWCFFPINILSIIGNTFVAIYGHIENENSDVCSEVYSYISKVVFFNYLAMAINVYLLFVNSMTHYFQNYTWKKRLPPSGYILVVGIIPMLVFIDGLRLQFSLSHNYHVVLNPTHVTYINVVCWIFPLLTLPTFMLSRHLLKGKTKTPNKLQFEMSELI